MTPVRVFNALPFGEESPDEVIIGLNLTRDQLRVLGQQVVDVLANYTDDNPKLISFRCVEKV